jgi:hypothetical protein
MDKRKSCSWFHLVIISENGWILPEVYTAMFSCTKKNTILVGAHPKLYPGKICWNPMIVPCFIQQNNVPQILFYPASCGSLAFYHGFWGCVEHERRMGLSIKIHQLSHDGRFYYSWLPFISNTILIKKITFMKPIPSRMNRNTILIIRLIDGYRWYRVDGYWFHQY